MIKIIVEIMLKGCGKIKSILSIFIVIMFLAIGIFSSSSIALKEILINSPSDNFETVENTILAGWTDYNGEFTHYSVQISDTEQFSSIIFEKNNTNTYQEFGSLASQRGYIRVKVYNETTVVGTSNTITFQIHEKPGFSISTDLLEYEDSKIVIFKINAPLNSKVDILVDGTNDEFSYHPSVLVQDEFRTILEPGDYDILANLTFHDYFTSFKSSFKIENIYDDEENNAANDSIKTNSEKNALFMCNISTKDENGISIPSVFFRYQTIYNETEKCLNGTNTTGKNGNNVLFLSPACYLFEFEKEGYRTERALIELDYVNISTVINLEIDHDYNKTSFNSTNMSDLSGENFIIIYEPENSSSMENKNVVFKYLLKEPENIQKCQLMINNIKKGGWSVAEENSVLHGGNETFLIESTEPGEFRAKIQCIYRANNTIYSNPVFFKLYDQTVDDHLVGEIITQINSALQKIRIMENQQKKVIISMRIQQMLETAKTELEAMNKNYDGLVKKGASEDEINKLIDDLEKKKLALQDELASDVLIQDKDNLAVYLPVSGFDEIFKRYLNEVEQNSEEESEEIIRNQKLVQEEFIIKKNIKEIKLTKMSGKEEKIMAVSEVVVFIDSDGIENMEDKDYKVVLFMDNPISSKEITFINDAKKISDNFYEVNVDKSGEIDYYFRDTVDLQSLKEVKTIIVSPRATSIDSPTGFAAFNNNGIIGKSGLSYTIILILTLSAVIGLLYFFSPKRIEQRSISALTQDIDSALNLLSRNEHKKSFSLYPKIMSGYSRLSEVNKSELSEIITHLKNEKDENNMMSLLVQLDEIMDMLVEEDAYNENLYNRVLKTYNMTLEAYNEISKEKKDKYYKKLNEIFSIISEIEGIRQN